MGPLSRRAFRTLVPALALVALQALPAQGPVHVPARLASSSPWLDELNQWRAISAVPPVTENTTWSAGDYDHAVYMVKNDLVTHYETAGTPYYTTAGDTAARNSNIYVNSSTSTTDVQAIDWWMQAPFHALGLTDPRLTQSGFGSYREVKSGWDMGAAVDVLRGNSFSGGTYPVYFPGQGTTEPLATYGGGEFPDPLQACPGYSVPTGLPVFVQVGGNVATTVTAHSFTGNGTPLAHCVIDSNSPSVGSGLTSRGAAILIPQAPLQTGVNYIVSLTVNGTPYTWSFKVGPFKAYNPLACTSSTGVTAPTLHAAAGTKVTISGTAVGCPNPQFRFWMLAPNSGWQILQDYSSTPSFAWTAPPTPGVYHLEVDARDQSSVASYDAAVTILFTVTGCTSATMSSAAAQPQAPGASITFTAAATGCPNPEFKFFLQAVGGSWVAQTAYGGASWTWNTSGLAAGVYGVGVWVHSIGSASTYESYWLGTFALSATPCTAASLSTASTAPQSPGTSIAYSASGCPGEQYRFWLLPPGGSWSMQRDYGGGGWTWNTTGLPAGTYQIGLWARQLGSSASYDAYAITTFVLGAGGCTSAGISPNVTPPAAPGSTVTFSASSNGCTAPQYQFWLLAPGGSWSVKQAFSAATTWTWNTSGLPLGTYQVGVWAKAGASSNRYDAYFIGTYQVNVTACTSAIVTASPASPQAAGTTITLTAASTGCASPTFEFWELPPPGSTWSMTQAWGAGNTFAWNSTGAAPGAYRFGVWVRQSGASSTYDSYAIITIWVT